MNSGPEPQYLMYKEKKTACSNTKLMFFQSQCLDTKKLVEQLSVYRAEATSLEKLCAFHCMEEKNIKDDHTFVLSFVTHTPPPTISYPHTFTFFSLCDK